MSESLGFRIFSHPMCQSLINYRIKWMRLLLTTDSRGIVTQAKNLNVAVAPGPVKITDTVSVTPSKVQLDNRRINFLAAPHKANDNAQGALRSNIRNQKRYKSDVVISESLQQTQTSTKSMLQLNKNLKLSQQLNQHRSFHAQKLLVNQFKTVTLFPQSETDEEEEIEQVLADLNNVKNGSEAATKTYYLDVRMPIEIATIGRADVQNYLNVVSHNKDPSSGPPISPEQFVEGVKEAVVEEKKHINGESEVSTQIKLLVSCQGGVRSKMAADWLVNTEFGKEMLMECGVTEVLELNEGYQGWKGRGLGVKRTQEVQRRNNVQQARIIGIATPNLNRFMNIKDNFLKLI